MASVPASSARRAVTLATIVCSVSAFAALPAPATTDTARSAAAPESASSQPFSPDLPEDPFFHYNRQAEHAVTSEDVRVPVRDGSEIACQLYRPDADGTFPGIVYEYTAYADNAAEFGRGASYFAARGYAALVCQARGSGTSPGHLDPFSPQEQRDNYDVIEWLAEQPWSTGDIGQMGVSYGGHSSLLAAANRPPHLRAIIPMNGLDDWYSNTIYRGGIYSPRIRDWQKETAPETLRTYARHPQYDDFWRDRSVRARPNAITVPTLAINGWYDRYRDGMVRNFQARPDLTWLVSGPWEHGYPEGQPAGFGSGAYLAWWDHWLRHDSAAPLPAAKVTSYEIPAATSTASAGWGGYDTWPPARTHDVRVSLRTDGSLGRGAGAPGPRRYAVNTRPQPPAPDEQVVYRTGPLRRDVVLAGSIEARIKASFPARDGAVAVEVSDIAPDGTSTRVTAGWLKASHRFGDEHAVPVRPGKTYTLPVHVWPTHYRLAEGHRLQIRVSSDDHPEIESSAPAGEVTVASGAGGSWASLPVLPPTHDTSG